MTHERDEYMRRQEAEHDMIRMREPRPQPKMWRSDREILEERATPEILEVAAAFRTKLSDLGHFDLAERRALLLTLSELAVSRRPNGHDGYVSAFYEIGAMLGFSASPEGPAHVWEHRMRPRLQATLEALDALDAAAWHLRTIASDIKNPGQRAIADKWVEEARAAVSKARGEAS